MEPPIEQPHRGRPPVDIASARPRSKSLDEHGRPFLTPPEGESSFGPLKPEELEFYAKLGDMSPPAVDDPAWQPTDEELANGSPEPDDPDARAAGAVWTGQYWRPHGRRVDWAPRTPLCPTDFVQMEITTVGWVCPDCGLVKL